MPEGAWYRLIHQSVRLGPPGADLPEMTSILATFGTITMLATGRRGNKVCLCLIVHPCACGSVTAYPYQRAAIHTFDVPAPPSHTHHSTVPSPKPIYKFGPYPSTHLISFPLAEAASTARARSGDEAAGRPTDFEGDPTVVADVARRAAAEAREEAVPKRLEPDGEPGASAGKSGS